MKILSKRSIYYSDRKEYFLKGVKKCSGFCNYWKIDIHAKWNGVSTYFVIARFHAATKTGKQYFTFQDTGIEIKKHCKTAWQAKRVMKFLYENPIDYVNNFNIQKERNI